MKMIMIYERKDIFYIRAASQTTAGVWIDDGDCYTISIDSEYEDIGKYVYIALNNSRANIPHPTDWKGINEPLLKTAKVKSWSTFGKTAKCVIVGVDKDIQLTPTKNKSSLRQGFVGSGDDIISIPLDVTNAELGKTVKEAWLCCE